MLRVTHKLHFHRIAGALIALFSVCAGSSCFAKDANSFANDDLGKYESPYRLSHRFLFGVSSSGLLTGDKNHPGAIDGASVGLTTEYFPLSVYSLGLRLEYYRFSTGYSASSGLGVSSISFVQKLIPAAGASFSPYLALGLGVTSNRNASRETITAGIGFQIRPNRQYWARLEATTVEMGLGGGLESVAIDGLNSGFQVGAYGVRLEFGIVR